MAADRGKKKLRLLVEGVLLVNPTVLSVDPGAPDLEGVREPGDLLFVEPSQQRIIVAQIGQREVKGCAAQLEKPRQVPVF